MGHRQPLCLSDDPGRFRPQRDVRPTFDRDHGHCERPEPGRTLGIVGHLLGNGDRWNPERFGHVLDGVDAAVYRDTVERQRFVQLLRRPVRHRPCFRHIFGRSGLSASTGTTTLVVEEASQTAVSASPSPVTFGSSVTYAATVTSVVTGLPTPTGSVTFTTGATTLCTAPLTNGTGSCSTSAAPAGMDTITGTYSSDSVFGHSTGTAPLVVNKAPSQTSIDVSPSTVTLGSSVTYSTTVTTSVSGFPTPTGTVTFTTGSTSLCTATLISNGSGSCSSTAAPRPEPTRFRVPTPATACSRGPT